MQFLTLDFETYYDKEYSLAKMTTEAYVRDERFYVHGVGIKDGTGITVYYPDDEVAEALAETKWGDTAVLCHNTMFDAFILSHHYGIYPKMLLDTLCMARALWPHESGALGSLAKRVPDREKGHELESFLGVLRLNDEQQRRMSGYCRNDVDLTFDLFQTMKVGFPTDELRLIDITLKMFTEPTLVLDEQLLLDHLDDLERKRETLLASVPHGLTALRSNDQFAALLRAQGVEPPMKYSTALLKRGVKKLTYAFAKTDEGMQALLDHENEQVQLLATARLGVKSSIEKTRTESFLGVASRGTLPVPISYCGARNTLRFAGADKTNLQNLPRGGALRKSICAPKGKKMIVCDLASIEARMTAYLAGQTDLLELFRAGADVYSDFASTIYGRSITKSDKLERFLGKVCLAEGTMVLSDSGWKVIETITTKDKLWDGEEWVCHQGLLDNGTKTTLSLCGLWLTPDHLVLSGPSWVEAQEAERDDAILYQALATGAANLPLQATSPVLGMGSPLSLLDVTAPARTTRWGNRTLRIFGVLVAQCAQKVHQVINGIGVMLKHCLTIATEPAYSTVYPQLSPAVTIQATRCSSITGAVASPFTQSGGWIKRRSCGIYKRLRGGITQTLSWIGSTQTGDTPRGTSGSLPSSRTSKTNGRSLSSRQTLRVYDLACAGPRNRFTVATDAGPLIVHNCILGLGYSMSWPKLASLLAAGPLGQAPILFSEADFETMRVGFLPDSDKFCELALTTTSKLTGRDLLIHCACAQHLVVSYRERFNRIPDYWRTCNKIISCLSKGVVREYGPVVTSLERLWMPNGLSLHYRNLRQTDDGDSWKYDAYKETTYLYGAKLTENIVQALSRIIMAEQMIRIAQRYKVVLTVHDENVALADEDDDEALPWVVEQMRIPPNWCSDLPLDAEGYEVQQYGEAK